MPSLNLRGISSDLSAIAIASGKNLAIPIKKKCARWKGWALLSMIIWMEDGGPQNGHNNNRIIVAQCVFVEGQSNRLCCFCSTAFLLKIFEHAWWGIFLFNKYLQQRWHQTIISYRKSNKTYYLIQDKTHWTIELFFIYGRALELCMWRRKT